VEIDGGRFSTLKTTGLTQKIMRVITFQICPISRKYAYIVARINDTPIENSIRQKMGRGVRRTRGVKPLTMKVIRYSKHKLMRYDKIDVEEAATINITFGKYIFFIIPAFVARATMPLKVQSWKKA
jgi:hypothetical protein